MDNINRMNPITAQNNVTEPEQRLDTQNSLLLKPSHQSQFVIAPKFYQRMTLDQGLICGGLPLTKSERNNSLADCDIGFKRGPDNQKLLSLESTKVDL